MTLNLRHGDRVKYVTNSGNVLTARIVMKSSYPGAWVGNAGGKYGRPVLISEQNFVGFVGRRK
jgi:hypothetical protein